MVGVTGIGGPVEPTGTNHQDLRSKQGTARASLARDDVQISQEAMGASRAVQLTEQAEDAVRAEQVARAKIRLEQGSYRVREVVESVAARISKYIGA